MAFSVLITLTTAGADTGPVFSLYSNIDSYSVPFEIGVAKASLLAGYLSNLVPNGTTIIRVISFGVCNTAEDLTISGFTTTTTSTTTTTTSTTSTTSTTTTFGPQTVTINPLADNDITDVRVDSVSVTGVSFPVVTGTGPVFGSFTGTFSSTIEVDAVGTPGVSTVRVIDSAGVNHDLPWIGNGTYSFGAIDAAGNITVTTFAG